MNGDSVDLVRDALQVGVNERQDDDGPGFLVMHYVALVMHYVALVGLCRANDDGTVDKLVIAVEPASQGFYVTDGLLLHADEVIAKAREAADVDE